MIYFYFHESFFSVTALGSTTRISETKYLPTFDKKVVIVRET
jgi:hypothetical protein